MWYKIGTIHNYHLAWQGTFTSWALDPTRVSPVAHAVRDAQDRWTSSRTTCVWDDKWASLGFPARVCGLLGIRIDGAASLLMVPVFSCYPGTYDAYSTVDSSRCCSLRCRATSRSTVRWQLPVSLAFLPSTPRMLCRLSSAWRTSILLVIALALQLQTILGEQLASDDQAGCASCILRSRLRGNVGRCI